MKYVDEFSLESLPLDQNEFHSILGLAMQLIDVRPDIVFPISTIAQKSSRERLIDMEALIYLANYFYSTLRLGVTLRRGNHASVTVHYNLSRPGTAGITLMPIGNLGMLCVSVW